MSEVNSVNSTTSYQRSADFGSGISGEGVMGLIDRVVADLQKMNNDMRDVQRDFAEKGVSIKYEKMATARKTKEEAIELNYEANMFNAYGKLGSGIMSLGGGFGGIFKSQKAGNAFNSGMGGIGKIAEGSLATQSALKTKEAGKKELLGDYQTTLSEDFNKNLNKVLESAKDFSREAKEMTSEMGKLQQQLFGAVTQIGR
jgi:hypothetical protein